MTGRIATSIKLALAGAILLLSLLAAQMFYTPDATMSNGWNDAISQEPGISLVCDPAEEPCPTGGGG